MKCPHCLKEFTARDAKIRSTPENRYYWGVCVDILSLELGYSPQEIHIMLKQKFLTYPLYLKLKDKVEEVFITRSTASLNTVDFEDYLSNIRVWASSDLGIFIPEPNEVIDEKEIN
jgi:hypothetical protein